MPPLARTLRTLAILAVAALALAACSKKRGASPFDPDAGHATDFLGQHFTLFRADSGSCITCHGVDLMGGISKVSCYSASREGQSCHPGGPGGHPIGWGAPPAHGATAKAVPGPGSGFGFCTGCHGADFQGGSGLSCSSCHGVRAPHPRGPWRGSGVTHTTTHQGNAPICAGCHDNPGNGLPPACFNNSLCHGTAGHPDGWGDPDSHGEAAKAAPGNLSGFDSCRACHGSRFGGDTGRACGDCHGVGAPHPPSPWRGGRTHTSTHTGNAPVCALCHDNQANALPPDCFNGSLCHGSARHPDGWGSPDQHGATAKAAPGAGSGFASCKACHGASFTGGSSGQSCSPCHGWNAPHARSGWDAGGASHRSTDEGNAGVCADCHRHTPGTAGCFNGTLCHGGGHPDGWASPTQHGSAAMRTPGFPNCQECHGSGFTGGTSGQSCFPCHGVNAPHPGGWRGGHDRTDSGYAAVCAQCHRENPGTAGCFNGTLCHGAKD